jgi:hypothetical protein
LVTAILLAAGAACSSDKDDNQGTGPGTGGSPAAGGTSAGGGAAGSSAGGVAGNGSQFQADAEAICAAILTLNCSNDQASTCVSSWITPADVQTLAGCGTQEKALYDCLALLPARDFMCSDNGFATFKPGVCQTEQADLGDCTG